MGRRPCCSKDGDLNKGAWTAMEDKILKDYIKVHGEGKWRDLPKKAGLKRCGKSCRLRWLNYLRPDIKRGNISHDEAELIVRLHKLLGNRWSLIAGRLPGRTDNEIKNYWNTNFGKKMTTTTTTTTQITTHQMTTCSNHKPSSNNQSSKEKPTTNATEHFVVRTKATRCTKVFTQLPEPQIMNANTSFPPVGVVVGPSSSAMVQQQQHLVPSSSSEEPLLMPPFLSSEEEEYNHPPLSSDNFLTNLEMDDCFLSDLLNTDFSQFCGGFVDEVDDDGVVQHDQAAADNKNKYTTTYSISTSTEHGGSSLLSSPNSDDPTLLLLSEQNLQHDTDDDVQLMASLLDSELNWF